MTEAITDPDKLDIIPAVRRKPYVDAVVVTEGNLEAVATWLRRKGFAAVATDFLGLPHVDIEDPRDENLGRYGWPGDVVVHDENGLITVYSSEDDFYEFYDWL